MECLANELVDATFINNPWVIWMLKLGCVSFCSNGDTHKPQTTMDANKSIQFSTILDENLMKFVNMSDLEYH
jgi:hypothetical protein